MPSHTSYPGFATYDSSLRRLPRGPVPVVSPSCRLLGLLGVAGPSPSPSLAFLASLASPSVSRGSPSAMVGDAAAAASRGFLLGDSSGTETVAGAGSSCSSCSWGFSGMDEGAASSGAGTRCCTDPNHQWRSTFRVKAALITT